VDFTARQREQTRRQQSGFVYTPQVSIQGRDHREWQSADRLLHILQTINKAPARGRISLQVTSGATAAGAVDVGVDAQLEPGYRSDTALTVALTQDGLVSEVAAGENAGKRLAHDHVVRAWQRGLALSSGKLRQDVHFALPADRGPLSVVAFIEDVRSGEVLQAVELALCDGRGSQALTWSVRRGRWAAVVMRPDGSPGVSADLAAGAKLPALLWASIGLLVLGLLALGGAAALIYFGARERHAPAPPPTPEGTGLGDR